MTGHKIPLGKSVKIVDGKVVKVPARMAAGQRKNAEGKAKREVASWQKRSKTK